MRTGRVVGDGHTHACIWKVHPTNTWFLRPTKLCLPINRHLDQFSWRLYLLWYLLIHCCQYSHDAHLLWPKEYQVLWWICLSVCPLA